MLNVQNRALCICLKKIFGVTFSSFYLKHLKRRIQSKTLFSYLILGKSVLHLILSNTGCQGGSMDNLSSHQPQECENLPKHL